MASSEQKDRVKSMLVDQLHLRMDPGEIQDEAPLFGDEGLGLDSVDAIELVGAIEQEFGVKFASEDEAKQVLTSVSALAAYLEERGAL